LQATVRIFFSDGNDEAQVRLDHLLLGDPRLALALLHHVDDAAELAERHAGRLRDFADFGADSFHRAPFGSDEGGPFLVDARNPVQPAIVQLMVHIAVEKVLARHLVPFGQTQHLAAQRGQAPVIGIKLIDQIFDLLLVELDAFDLGGQAFAQFVIAILFRLAQRVAIAHGQHARGLDARKGAENLRDGRKLLQRHRLERFFHLRKGEGVVLFLFLFGAAGATLARTILILVGVGGLLFGLLLFLEAGTGGLFAYFAIIILGAFFQAFGRRVFGQHRVEIQNLAQLHFAIVERRRPFDDRVEGRRAFAQAQDHGVATGLDPLGDGDFALTAEQFHRTHFAQIHANGIVGAIDRFLLLFGDQPGRAVIVLRHFIGVVIVILALLVLTIIAGFFIFDDVDAHVVKRGHDILDLLGRHLVLGQGAVQFVIGDVAALLGTGEQLLDRGFVQVEQRGIATFISAITRTRTFAVRLGRHLFALTPPLLLAGAIIQIPRPMTGRSYHSMSSDCASSARRLSWSIFSRWTRCCSA